MIIEEPLILQNLRSKSNTDLLKIISTGQSWFENYCLDIGSPENEAQSLLMSTAIDELQHRIKE